ncbi:DUF1993 family protein [Polymorphobacter sp.]|uniref:DUF1993 family protein n=1 Tax=Polymorphobacter sp. TaxID=1909290 RepID=UPI003F7165EC
MQLHDAFVPTALQILAAGRHVLDKAEAHCASTGQPPEALLELRLAPDMLALPFQAFSMMHHTAGALAGLRAGVFSPARPEPGLDFVALQAMLASAEAALAAVSPEEMEALAAKPMHFSAGERQMAFTGHDFLLSFSQPNFFFHASMLYAIARHGGVPLAKPDFLGRPRISR